MGAAMTLLLGGLLQAQATMAMHVVPLLPPTFLQQYCSCNGSPDQCALTFVVTIVRALMFHPC